MKCSIVMSTYDHAPLLRRTLASIYKQHPPFEWECIVVDDGDPDPTTAEVCREFPVRYVRIDREPGFRNPAHARNVGYKLACGGVIIAQSDDVMHASETTIQDLVAKLSPGTFVIATVRNVDANMQPSHTPFHEFTGLNNQRPFFFLGAVYRRDLYAVGGNDEDFIAPGYDDDWFAAV